jgi:hypothetical protein
LPPAKVNACAHSLANGLACNLDAGSLNAQHYDSVSLSKEGLGLEDLEVDGRAKRGKEFADAFVATEAAGPGHFARSAVLQFHLGVDQRQQCLDVAAAESRVGRLDGFEIHRFAHVAPPYVGSAA